jgi:hypothetical protein
MAAKKRTKKTELQEAKKNHEVWTATALCLGFNELAKLGKNLGEKVYARLARDVHVKRFVELGGNARVAVHRPRSSARGGSPHGRSENARNSAYIRN